MDVEEVVTEEVALGRGKGRKREEIRGNDRHAVGVVSGLIECGTGLGSGGRRELKAGADVLCRTGASCF